MSNIGNIWSQMYPPKPSFTEANLPDLAGKVRIRLRNELHRKRLPRSRPPS